MGRKELQQQAVLGVEKVLRRQPTNWRHNLASYILLAERTFVNTGQKMKAVIRYEE